MRCGYYGKQGHIAQFERDLDSLGLHEKILSPPMNPLQVEHGKGREQSLLETKILLKPMLWQPVVMKHQA